MGDKSEESNMKILNLLFGSTLIWFMACWLTTDSEAAAGSKNIAKSAQPEHSLEQSYTWYDGNQERKIWLNPNLLAEFGFSVSGQSLVKKAHTDAKPLATRRKGVRLWQLGSGSNSEAVIHDLKTLHPNGQYSPVFHDTPRVSGRMRAIPGNIIVYLNPNWDETDVNHWASQRKLQIVKKLEIGTNIFVLKTGAGLETLEIANSLYKSKEVIAAFPDWWEEAATR
jgi:hypothetical protein